MKLVVVHSPHQRCGIREYGLGLDRSLGRHFEVLPTTFDSLHKVEAEAILVHFEPYLMPEGALSVLKVRKHRGVKIVFCCHWYDGQHAEILKYRDVVDRFVVHRNYGPTQGDVVEIPLGCPVYDPSQTREQIRSDLGLPLDRKVVTSLGFIAPWKRWPAVIDAVMRRLDGAFLQLHVSHPFEAQHGEEAAIRTVLSRFPSKDYSLSTDFIGEKDLLDLAYASDLGFVFHPHRTGSVSAATKAFVSARCPAVLTKSNHSSDIREGVVHADTLDDVEEFARAVAQTIKTDSSALREGVEREYARLNMDAVADRYAEILR